MNLEKLMFQLPNTNFKKWDVEKEFTWWFWKCIKSKWWHRWKISDMDTRKKPYDWLLVYDGISAQVEIKQSSNTNNVNLLKLLLPHQIVWLTEVQKNDWKAIVIFYSPVYHKYRIKEFSTDEEKMKLILKD